MLSNNEIRVFELLPPSSLDNHQAPIQGRTRVVSLSTSIAYETLSYVWGDGYDKTSIQVDGIDVPITKTLESALKRLRLPDAERVLWIDQLCINQDDDAERAVQVPLMGQIYSNTCQCLIWLGEIRQGVSEADASSAFDIIRFLDDYDEAKAADLTVPPCLASETTMAAPMNALRSIGLGENAWWHRMWTLQEVVLPFKACMLWGPLHISWQTIIGAGQPKPNLIFDRAIQSYLSDYNSFFTQTIGLEMSKQRAEGPMRTAFRWGFRRASNPLDKVYGFLGLFPPGTLKRASLCDYKLPAAKLYAMFTADLVEHEKSLHPIALWNCNHLPDTTPGMSSWAFDMGNPVREFVHLPINMTPVDSAGDSMSWFLMNNYDWYNASAGLEIDWKTFQFDAGKEELMLAGCLVDTISVAGTPLESNNLDTKHVSDQRVIECITHWYQQVDDFYSSRTDLDHSRGTESWHDSFWRGLIGNLVGEDLDPERVATESDITLVKEFVRTGKREPLCVEIFATMVYRTMFVTREGLIGFGPRHLRVSDEVWILHGGRVPFILRPHQRGGVYRLIGPSYVDGIMYGEAARESTYSNVTLA